QHEGTDLEIAGILRDIGLVIRGKDLPQAILVEREALTIRRRLSPDSDDVADSLTRLAGILTSAGQHEEAEALAREAVSIRRKLSGSTPSMGLATSLETLAGILQHEEKLSEAEAAARESLQTMRQAA